MIVYALRNFRDEAFGDNARARSEASGCINLITLILKHAPPGVTKKSIHTHIYFPPISLDMSLASTLPRKKEQVKNTASNDAKKNEGKKRTSRPNAHLRK